MMEGLGILLGLVICVGFVALCAVIRAISDRLTRCRKCRYRSNRKYLPDYNRRKTLADYKLSYLCRCSKVVSKHESNDIKTCNPTGYCKWESRA